MAVEGCRLAGFGAGSAGTAGESGCQLDHYVRGCVLRVFVPLSLWM